MVMTFPRSGDTFRRNNFDFIRLLLAVAVLLAHAQFLSAPSDYPFYKSISFVSNFGEPAVNYFFLISGFLITASWVGSKSTWDYFVKRIKRIYPGFIVAAMVCVIVVAPIVTLGKLGIWNFHWMVEGIARTLSLHGIYCDQSLMHARSIDLKANPPVGIINGSIWTVRYEFICYVLVAGMGLIGLFKRNWLTLLATALLMAWWFYTAIPSSHGHNTLLTKVFGSDDRFPRFFACFAVGMAFYFFREKIILSIWPAIGAIALLVLWHHLNWRYMEQMDFFLTAYPVMYIAYCRWLPLQNFGKYGDFSYGTYLWGWPVQLLIIYAFPTWQMGAVFIASTVISVALGAISWHFIEKRFLIRSHRVPPEVRREEQAHAPAAAASEVAGLGSVAPAQ